MYSLCFTSVRTKDIPLKIQWIEGAIESGTLQVMSPTLYQCATQDHSYKTQPCLGRVLHGSVIKSLTPDPGVLGFRCIGSSGLVMGVSLGKTLQSPSLVLVKPKKDINDVSCHRDMTEMK